MKKIHQISLVFLLVSLMCATSMSAQKWGRGIKGEGPIITKDLDVSSFTGIVLANSANVYVTQGSTQKITAEGQANIIDNLKTKVKGNNWVISFRDNVAKYKTLKIYITVPTITNLTVSGSGNLITKSNFDGLDDLDVHISGSGNIEALVDGGDVDSHISGSGNISLVGSAQKLDIHISGSGNVNSYKMETKKCKVHISGSGECRVNVRNDLNVSISGSGDVSYKGDPDNVRSKISGSGDVRSKG